MTTEEPTAPADTRTREQLVSLVEAGARPKYLLFWGHRPESDGRIGAGSLSQWWPGAFTVDGVTYRTAEHWMMAGKARLFQDEETLARILTAPTPGEAKKLGRMVRGFDDERWVAERFELVVAGNVAKFGQDEALRNYLLGTSQRVLVEASPLDRLWGIGLAADNERATRPHEWRGLNLLGFALMEARARLIA
ncbi:NADAR family protein [Streptomyces sp. NRRL B-24484]|uniref:NADAR family protein n=1 Tax=Streptomyces sp. NRRL B-24484 TaxID=1463833 RepID=UPI000693C95F|nr:NADAR family protein [Streptomyces sp. NRRL B-24484]